MAKRSKQASDDSSDDEAPEAVSFGTSKKTAKGEQDALQQHHASQKHKKKEKNRAIDRALKDRSANTKGKGKAVGDRSGKVVKKAESPSGEEESGSDDAEESTRGGPSRKDLEERMARAMMEAEGESGSEEDDEEFTGFGDDVEMDGEDEEMSDDDEESGGEDDDEDEESLDEAQSDGDEDENEGMGSEDEDDDEEQEAEESTRPLSAPRKDDYLPDHLFEAALSHTGKKIVFDEDPLPSPQASRPQKRQRTKRTSEDILLGSRTIRILPKPSTVVSPAVLKGLTAPRRVNKFVKASLNLRGDATKAKSKGWNRQPANLGVMRRHGPAAHFVRAS